jgi:hypothetical protein
MGQGAPSTVQFEFLFREKSIKFLSNLMIKTGALLSQQIDSAASTKSQKLQKRSLEQNYQRRKSTYWQNAPLLPF